MNPIIVKFLESCGWKPVEDGIFYVFEEEYRSAVAAHPLPHDEEEEQSAEGWTRNGKFVGVHTDHSAMAVHQYFFGDGAKEMILDLASPELQALLEEDGEEEEEEE